MKTNNRTGTYIMQQSPFQIEMKERRSISGTDNN
jgi:hypothetical protein